MLNHLRDLGTSKLSAHELIIEIISCNKSRMNGFADDVFFSRLQVKVSCFYPPRNAARDVVSVTPADRISYRKRDLSECENRPTAIARRALLLPIYKQ